MTLALVQATVFLMLTLIGTWTGLLVSVAFLLPRAACKSEQLISAEPWKCFFRGLGMAVILVLGLVTINAGLPIIKLVGFTVLMFVGAVIAVGSAGMAQTIGRRGDSESAVPTFAMLTRGSLVYSLALGFPFVGWFVFSPLALVTAAGAGIMALVPERRAAYTPPGGTPNPNDNDLSGRTGVNS